MHPIRISYGEADARLGEALSDAFEGGYDTVMLFGGPVSVDGDFLDGLQRRHGPLDGAGLVVITGDLTVGGRLALPDRRPGLYVGGAARAQSLECGEVDLFLRAGEFPGLVSGSTNRGSMYTHGIRQLGRLRTPWLINPAHFSECDPGGALLVDNEGGARDVDFGDWNIAASFAAGVVHGTALDIDAFREHVLGGQAVLRPGARTATEAALAEIADARDRRGPELDLTGRRLRSLPELALPWLRSLVLDGNPLGALPDAFGALGELEVLSVRDCGLRALPPSIGALPRLRVLRVGGNRPLVLPELSQVLDELDVASMPDVMAWTVPARRLIADGTALAIPPAMRGRPEVEEISMAGNILCPPREFPLAVTTFAGLRVLDLARHAFAAVPDELLRLARLESLSLRAALAAGATLPDLSRLPALRRLDLSLNGLTALPDWLFALPAVEVLDLRYNDLPDDLRGRVTAAYPSALV